MAIHYSPHTFRERADFRGKDRSSARSGGSISRQQRDITPKKLRYESRKLAGLCCYGNCSEKNKEGFVYCRRHLRQMLKQVSELYRSRAEEKLCFRCGTRPQFWGKRCVICRQLVAKDPLPRGAKEALRKYRELEAQRAIESRRETYRNAARELLKGRTLRGRQPEALRLYFGLDDNGWRTHRQVAELMNVSAERVRQLLLPAKRILASVLTETIPGRSAKRVRKRTVAVDLLLTGTPPPMCHHSKSQFLRGPSHTYTLVDLPDVVIHGLPSFRCPQCSREEARIPHPQELHDILARTLLSKTDPLCGKEIRFLRRVAGMKVTEFAERLDVTHQTLQKWETLPALSLVNEIAARIVIASRILDTGDSSQLLTLTELVRKGEPKSSLIQVEWCEASDCWRYRG